MTTPPGQSRRLIKSTILIKVMIGLLLFIVAANFPALAQNKVIAKTDSVKKTDSVFVKLRKAREALTRINTLNKESDRSKQVRAELTEVKKQVSPIDQDLKVSKNIESKRLSSYNVILKQSQDKLGTWRKTLGKTGTDLKKSSKELTGLVHDSLLNIFPRDSGRKAAYSGQLAEIKTRVLETNQATTTRLDSLNKLLAEVSAAYLEIADLQTDVNEKLKVPKKSSFQQESPYLWSAPKEQSTENVKTNLSTTYEGQNKILGDFMNTNWDDRALLIILGGAFFMWVYLNYRNAEKPEAKKNIGELNFRHISPIPVVPSIIILLNILPLFEPEAPALYIEIVELLLLTTLTVFFWHRLLKSELRPWLFLVLLYIIIMFTDAAVHNGLFMRLLLMALNVASLFFGLLFYKKLLKAEVAEKFIKPVSFIYLALNILAVAFNVFGRISLAKIFTTTAIISITEVVGLAVFIQILTDALELQIKVSACNGGLFSRINLDKTRNSFKRALSVFAIVLWLLVFFINLGISKQVFSFVFLVLDGKRSLGSINFTLGNVLFFAIILYLSNIFQRHIGVLFGEKSISFSNEVEHKSSKLTLIRLIIAIIGVLFAVTASGIPLDKLTVVLGALSVGIGLGMQNIVNNFVSGIILIFEHPFQIGDFVELADKKGKIQDIGIRASRMLTQQGSEVIIPNGDLISNRFVNWTINSANVKSEILFKVNMAADMTLVYKIIEEEINASADTVKNNAPEILVNSIAADTVELRILIWITSIYVEANFKSRLFTQLIIRFNQAGIKIM